MWESYHTSKCLFHWTSSRFFFEIVAPLLEGANRPARTSGLLGGSSGSSCGRCDPAAPRPCPGHPGSPTGSVTVGGKSKDGVGVALRLLRATSALRPPDLYLVVRVMEAHRLTEGHFCLRLQVVQLDGSRKLQDPAEETRGQEVAVPFGPCLDQKGRVSPLLPSEFKLHPHIVLRRTEWNSATPNFSKSSEKNHLRGVRRSPGSWAKKFWVFPTPTGMWRGGWSGAVRPSPAWSSSGPPAHLWDDRTSNYHQRWWGEQWNKQTAGGECSLLLKVTSQNLELKKQNTVAKGSRQPAANKVHTYPSSWHGGWPRRPGKRTLPSKGFLPPATAEQKSRREASQVKRRLSSDWWADLDLKHL